MTESCWRTHEGLKPEIINIFDSFMLDFSFGNLRIPSRDDITNSEYMQSIGYTPTPTDLAILMGASVFLNEYRPELAFCESNPYSTLAITGDSVDVYNLYIYAGDQFSSDEIFSQLSGSVFSENLLIGTYPFAYQLCMDVEITNKNATFEEAVDVTPGIRRDGNNYYISTAEGLNLLSELKNAPPDVDRDFNPAWTFYLENDIDMSAYSFFGLLDFTGTFDGQGHSVTIMQDNYYAGLFMTAKNATIKNLTIKGGVFGNTAAGGFIGQAEGTIDVIDCRNEAEIGSINFAGGCIGMVANNSVITITNFVNMRDIKGGIASGGVIGQSENNPTFNFNKIYIDSNQISASHSAGLIGRLYGNNDNGSINISEIGINANLLGSVESGGFYLLGTTALPMLRRIKDSYFNGTGINLEDGLSGLVTQITGVFNSITKKYYAGVNDEKWVTGVNGGTAGLKCFLAIGSLAPVNDVESYLASKGFTQNPPV